VSIECIKTCVRYFFNHLQRTIVVVISCWIISVSVICTSNGHCARSLEATVQVRLDQSTHLTIDITCLSICCLVEDIDGRSPNWVWIIGLSSNLRTVLGSSYDFIILCYLHCQRCIQIDRGVGFGVATLVEDTTCCLVGLVCCECKLILQCELIKIDGAVIGDLR